MPDFTFLATLATEAWLGIAVVVILLAALIYYFFEIGELELGIPPKVKLTRRVRSRAQPSPPPTPPSTAPETPPAVNLSGGTVDVKGHVIGGGVTKRDEYNFPNSNVTINQPAAPVQPPPTPLAYAPQHVAPVYIARGIEEKVKRHLLSGNGKAALVSVYAPGGVGKTELATQIQSELRGHFEETFWLNCNDKSPEAVLDDTARAVACQLTPTFGFDARLTELAAHLAQHRYLLIFDDVRADNVALFQKFMPPAPCAALLTSRLTEISHQIPPDGFFHLNTMNATQARALLDATLTPERVQAEADAAARLLERCRYHPLALDIAARLILKLANEGVAQPIAAIEKRIAKRLSALQAGDDERNNLFAVFDTSYDDLTGAEQMRFRQLAVFAPSGFGIPAVASLWQTDESTAETTLERFCNFSLTRHNEQNAARFRFHDLLDEYAAAHLKEVGEENKTRDAHAQDLVNLFEEHTLDDLSNARHVADELDNLRAACAWATQSKNGKLLAQLATTPRNWLYNIFRINEEWLEWLTTALRLEIADKELQANTLQAIGDVQQFRKDMDAALKSYEQALELFRAVGDRLGEANTRKAIGDVQRFRSDNDAALTSYEQALGLFREVGSRLGEANALKATGDVLQFLDKRDEALARYDEALQLFRAVGSRLGEANTLASLGELRFTEENFEVAFENFESAQELYEKIGDKYSQSRNLTKMGDAQRRKNEFAQAMVAFERAINIFPESPQAWIGKANLLQIGGDTAKAIETLQQASVIMPDDRKIQTALKSYQMLAGQQTDMSEILSALSPMLPMLLNANDSQLEMMMQLGKQMNLPGMEMFTPVVLFASFAEMLETQGDHDHALRAYERALEFNRDDAHIWNGLGNTLQSLERYEEAIEAYSHALALESDAPYLIRNRANVLLNLNRLEEAERDIAHAVESDPDNFYTHARQGELALRRGEFEAAATHYEYAVARDEDVGWKFGLALAKYGAGDVGGAKALGADALAQADKDKKQETRKWFERVANVRPELAGAAQMLLEELSSN